jgi:hypothetical protein
VSHDNVIKMARQAKICVPPACGLRRVCCHTSFVVSLANFEDDEWDRRRACSYLGRASRRRNLLDNGSGRRLGSSDRFQRNCRASRVICR